MRGLIHKTPTGKTEAIFAVQGETRSPHNDPIHRPEIERAGERMEPGEVRRAMFFIRRGKLRVSLGGRIANLEAWRDRYLAAAKKKAPATTSAPGISGFQQRADASRQAQRNRRRESAALGAFLSQIIIDRLSDATRVRLGTGEPFIPCMTTRAPLAEKLVDAIGEALGVDTASVPESMFVRAVSAAKTVLGS